MAGKGDSDNKKDDRSRGRAAGAYEAARERTYSAYEAARGRATDVSRQAADQIGVYPVGAVIGGLVVGALLGWAMPRTRRESELLGSTGRRLTEAARDAAQKGVEAGRDRIEKATGKVVTRVGSAVAEAVGGED